MFSYKCPRPVPVSFNNIHFRLRQDTIASQGNGLDLLQALPQDTVLKWFQLGLTGHSMHWLSCWLLVCEDPVRGTVTILARGVGISKADHICLLGSILCSYEIYPGSVWTETSQAFLRKSHKNPYISGKTAGIEAGNLESLGKIPAGTILFLWPSTSVSEGC